MPRFEQDQGEISMDGAAAAIGVDVGITKRISAGIHHNFASNLQGDVQDINSGLITPFDYGLNHTIIRGRLSTDPWRFFSVYFTSGLHFISYKYQGLIPDRSATGFSGGAGLVLRIGRIRINAFELNAITLNNHLYSDSIDDKFYVNVKAGIAFRIIEPL